MLLLNNPQRLAKLLASLNVQGSNRPLSPVEVANEIKALQEDLGGDFKETIKRLPVSAEIAKQFMQIMALPSKIQDVIVWGESSKKDGSIGFSVAAKMAKLSNHNDILKLAGTILDMPRPVTKEELKGLLSLKKRNPDKSIDECISEVLNVTREFTVQHFLFISKINSSIASALIPSESGRDAHGEALAILKGSFPQGTLKDVKVSNERVRLALDEAGWKFIAEYSGRHNLPRQDVVDHMLKSAGFANG